MTILVTGGAGYIGAHMAHALVRAGERVVVVDDLRRGHRASVPAEAIFAAADIADRGAITEVLRAHAVTAVMHFAAYAQVGESVKDPRSYYANNFVSALALIDACIDARVSAFVLSSTAAVYGEPIRTPIDEDHPTKPVNPYGATKLALEGVLEAYGVAHGLRWAALRYFNAAGAAFGLREHHDPETHLIPLAIDAALGTRPGLTVFGEDWPTPDGTCIRDYVHVLDLCDAHRLALTHITREGSAASGAFNLGSGEGASVRAVIDAVGRAAGKPVPFTVGPRRAGDPAVLVASSAKARAVLGWNPSRGLTDIVRDALASRT
ncbi:UDP-glucose 4-epimerase GalE [soil metagenome]